MESKKSASEEALFFVVVKLSDRKPTDQAGDGVNRRENDGLDSILTSRTSVCFLQTMERQSGSTLSAFGKWRRRIRSPCHPWHCAKRDAAME